MPTSAVIRVTAARILELWVFAQLIVGVKALSATSSTPPPPAPAARDDPRSILLPVYFDSSNGNHRDIYYHAETPERITVCVQALQQYQKEQQQQHRDDNGNVKQIQLYDVAPAIPRNDDDDSATRCVRRQPLTDAERHRARDVLLRTHDPELVTKLEDLCHRAREQRAADGKGRTVGFIGRVDADTYVTTETFDVCLRATAIWMRAVDDCWNQGNDTDKDTDKATADNQIFRSNRINAAVALTRPPGHHATYALQNGFCLYNFAAAAALHAVSCGCRRVSLLDWDVHYGQGCADIVRRFRREHPHEDDPTIRYVSIHQTPAFPYEGQKAEIIDDVVLTLPMPPDTTWTGGYQDLWHRALDFGCCHDPDLVIVCAGYDALASDPLASGRLTARDFGVLTRSLRARVGDSVGIVLGLEGGYCLADGGLSGTLADAVLATVRALADEPEKQ